MENATQKKNGKISVNTTDIFPIIKKWLYSEHDIFLRELVANATDAITKRATLSRVENLECPQGKINIFVSKKDKTIKITDNGLGMTEAEIEKYLAQLAFSGAEEFVNKMKQDGTKLNTDIIGKFGLGFYSAFMVASKVSVESLSYRPASEPSLWVSEGETDYTFYHSSKDSIGTTITLHLNEESEEFLSAYKVQSTLKKFCDFMPYEIEIFDVDQEAKKDEAEDTNKNNQEFPFLSLGVVNTISPIWKSKPSALKDEDYIEFYRKEFPMDGDPLFWIHLNVDHPFTLEGVLFFPKLNPNKPFNDSNIRLYNKQVFVSNQVKEIIPEFLSLLKGHLDSSDIPLNVSRSSLQGDPNIKKISNYVIKKVAEALKKLFNNDRAKFEKIWPDISLFVKYGAISDSKFDEMMREFIIFKNAEDKFATFKELEASIPTEYTEKCKGKVIYFEQGKSDLSLKTQLKNKGIPCIITESYIDPHFMQHVEFQKVGEQTVKFVAIDAAISDLFEKGEVEAVDLEVKEFFTKILISDQGKNDQLDHDAKEKAEMQNAMINGGTKDIELMSSFDREALAYFRVDEMEKRMQMMAKQMGNEAMFPVKKTLVINPKHPLIKNALTFNSKGNEELATNLCYYVRDLANISSEGLSAEDREAFVKRSQNLMEQLSKMALQ